jgi:hypothetical protein
MREEIKKNIKSEISSEVKREAKNIPVSVSNLLSTDDTTPPAGYLAPLSYLIWGKEKTQCNAKAATLLISNN